MEIQTINLSANVPQTFLIPGKYLEIIEAPYPLSIAFYDREGNALADGGLVNAESGLFVDMRSGNGWGSIQVSSANAQTVRLLSGSMMGGSRRQPGVVQVVDGARARTAQGNAFSEPFAPSTPAAGNTVRVGLWNPAGSGRRMIVKAVTVSSSSAQAIGIGWTTTALGGLSPLAGQKNPGNAYAFQLQRGQTEGTPAALTINVFVLPQVQANSSYLHVFQEPIVLGPGYGIIVQPAVTATNVQASIEGYEEAI